MKFEIDKRKILEKAKTNKQSEKLLKELFPKAFEVYLPLTVGDVYISKQNPDRVLLIKSNANYVKEKDDRYCLLGSRTEFLVFSNTGNMTLEEVKNFLITYNYSFFKNVRGKIEELI